MTLNASLRNRVRRLEQRMSEPRPPAAGLVLRPGVALPEARRRIDAATALAPILYVANLSRLPLRKD